MQGCDAARLAGTGPVLSMLSCRAAPPSALPAHPRRGHHRAVWLPLNAAQPAGAGAAAHPLCRGVRLPRQDLQARLPGPPKPAQASLHARHVHGMSRPCPGHLLGWRTSLLALSELVSARQANRGRKAGRVAASLPSPRAAALPQAPRCARGTRPCAPSCRPGAPTPIALLTALPAVLVPQARAVRGVQGAAGGVPHRGQGGNPPPAAAAALHGHTLHPGERRQSTRPAPARGAAAAGAQRAAPRGSHSGCKPQAPARALPDMRRCGPQVPGVEADDVIGTMACRAVQVRPAVLLPAMPAACLPVGLPAVQGGNACCFGGRSYNARAAPHACTLAVQLRWLTAGMAAPSTVCPLPAPPPPRRRASR